jgi:CubicO group peptidase (beta-lactamase class C family)
MTKKQTKNIIRIILLVGTVISMFFVPWIIVKTWLAPLSDTVQEQVNEATSLGFDGIIVYVDEGGKPPAFYVAGWKNKEKKTKADPHALFKIASVGKLYDAVSIAKLVYSGRLSLDSTLAYYMPNLVGRIQYANKITLRNLVEHRSGIPDITSTPNFWTNPPKNSEEALKRVFGLPADFQPGKRYEYSNTNYVLIGEIIQKVTGKSKFQYIRKNILEPLGLKHTFGSIHDVNMDDLMSGYYVGVVQDIKDSDYGSMVATAKDLGTFIRALNDGSVFKNNAEQKIYSSIYRYNHTGLIPGYQTIAKYHKDIDAVVIQFTNTTNFDGYNWNLSEVVYHRIVKILRKRAQNKGV